MTQPPYSQPPYGQSPYGQSRSPIGQPPYGQPQPPIGQPPIGRDPRDPHAPFGAVPQSVSIDSYAPPRPKISLIIAVLVAVIALVTALVVLTQPTDPLPPAKSTAPPATATPSWGQEFLSDDYSISGKWAVVSHEWTIYGLHVQVRIAVDKGRLRPSFAMFANDASETVYPLETPDSPGFEDTLNAGSDQTSWLTFSIRRGNVTIILGDLWSRQLSALPIAA